MSITNDVAVTSAQGAPQLGEPQTRFDRDPCRMKTTFAFELGGVSRLLTISTWKRTDGGGLMATARVGAINSDGTLTTVIFGDFSHTILRAMDRAREKAIRSLHARALAEVPALMVDVVSFYGTHAPASTSAAEFASAA
jgi:hypothetical protein